MAKSKNTLVLLAQLKNDSLDDANLRVGRSVFSTINARCIRLYQQISEKLDEPTRPNATRLQESEMFVIKEVNRRFRIDAQIDAMVEILAKNLLPLRDRYYVETMLDITDSFNSQMPGFMQLEFKPNAVELSSLPSVVGGATIKENLNVLRSRTKNRLRNIIVENYRPVEGKKREYKVEYREALKGALNQFQRTGHNILKGLITQTFEVAQNRFWQVVNG